LFIAKQTTTPKGHSKSLIMVLINSLDISCIVRETMLLSCIISEILALLLADRTNGRVYATVLSVVCNVMYWGTTVQTTAQVTIDSL